MHTSFSFEDAADIAHSPFTLSLSYSTRPHREGWAVIQHAHYIDRRGEKDSQDDLAALCASEDEAKAEAERLNQHKPRRRRMAS